MAIRKLDELMDSIKEKIGEDTSDDTISFLEDITDTFQDYETRVKDETNWKAKYEQNDAEWRQKYISRFYESSGEEDEDDNFQYETPKPKKLEFENLFEVVK